MNTNFDFKLNSIAVQYVDALNIKLTATTLNQALVHDPYYPSLNSLTSVFNKFNIPNESFFVDEKFKDIETPFLAYTKGDNYDYEFVLIKAIKNDLVHYTTGENKLSKETIGVFLKRYKKIVFVAEPNETSGEQNYERNLKNEKISNSKKKLLKIGLSLTIFLLYSLAILSFTKDVTFNLGSFVFVSMIKALGVGTTVLLLIYEIDNDNSFLKNVCSISKEASCDALLKSSTSKFLGMSWSEMGFYYYTSTSLFLLYPALPFLAKTAWLGSASTLISPFILFSIYYQLKVVKQWCPLCLIVQVVIFLEFIWSIFCFWMSEKDWTSFQSITNTAIIIVCIMLPITAWNLMRPVFSNAKEAISYQAAFKRLQYNKDVFQTLLRKQSLIPEGWQSIGIEMGNPNAANTIIKVCNPFCSSCSAAHQKLKEIITENNTYNLRIIFISSNESNLGGKVVRHLLGIAAKGVPDETEQALDYWYDDDLKIDYQKLLVKYPLSEDLMNEQDGAMYNMSNWCKAAKIEYTPTIFIGNNRLPLAYSVEELKYVL